MRTPTYRRDLVLLSFAACTLAFAGCGSSAPDPQGGVERGVFTSATDCAEAGKLTLDQCSLAIAAAIAEHEQTAPLYPSLKSCEKVEGSEKCERTDTKAFRPRLLAFVVTMSDPPEAQPLYPTSNGEAGFRTASKKVLLSDDESLMFSKPALAAAELNVGNSNGGGYNF
jgi:uncharacterized protein YgiB involved in biofilm formation